MGIRENGTLRVADKQADLAEPVGEVHPGSHEEWTYDGMVIFNCWKAGIYSLWLSKMSVAGRAIFPGSMSRSLVRE